MIQRIQTVYLILSAFALLAMFLFPIAAFNLQQDSFYVLDVFGLKDAGGNKVDVSANFAMPVIITVTALLIIFTLFQYRNRKRQMKLGRLAYLLIAGILVALFFVIKSNAAHVPAEHAELSYGPAYFMPIVAVIFMFLANRSIRKDEELVRSLDRLR